MRKIPFYPSVLNWWYEMDYAKKCNIINFYWMGKYTPETISSNLMYCTFLFEKDNGNIDDSYLNDVVYHLL